jgi:hypothetical protein
MSPHAICDESEVSGHLAREIKQIGRSIPAVAKIHASEHGSRISVWTVVEDFSRAIRNEIYD